MKSNILLLVIFYLLIIANASEKNLTQEENDRLENGTYIFNNIKPSIKIGTTEEYDRLLNTTDVTYLIFYYKRVHLESQVVASYLAKIAQKLDYLGYIMTVDCASKYGRTARECDEVFDKPEVYPKVKILSPPEYRFNPYTKKMNPHEEVPYTGPLTEDHLYNLMTNNIIARSSKLSGDNLDMFLG